MTDLELQSVAEKLGEIIYKSHSSLAKTYSNQQGEILGRLGTIDFRLLGIEDKQRIANGRTLANEKDIEVLRLAEARADGAKKVLGKFGSAVWGLLGGVSIVAIEYLMGVKR